MDGPLVLEVRYPTAAPIAVGDSVSLWGTVGTGRASLRVNGRSVPVRPNGAFATFMPLAAGDAPTLDLEARLGDSTIRRSIRVARTERRVSPPPVIRPESGWVALRRLPNDTLDEPTRARPIFSRWTPGGALAVALPQDIRLPVEAGTGDAVRLGLARGVSVWVAREDTHPSPPRHEPRVEVSSLRLSSGPAVSAVELASAERLASHVEVVGTRMKWTLFGARAAPDSLRRPDGLVRRVVARDDQDGRVVIEIVLARAPLGWRSTWRGGRMALEIRPAPPAGTGLEGLVVALDPGHPPLGSTGPTGLREDSVTLAVARVAAAELAALGAEPFLTRESAAPVSLDQRVALAVAADAQVFVSIHLNAPGDGRPPESVDGTRVYWLDPIAVPLAKALRDSVARKMGQQPVSVIQSDLVVLRATWYPVALVEATALVMPEREAYLRTPEGVAAYARGVVGGIQAWMATMP